MRPATATATSLTLRRPGNGRKWLEEARADSAIRAWMLEVDELVRFEPIAEVELPEGDYELVDVDTGADTLNVTPNQALERILEAGRSPLTLEEGISLVMGHPEAVAPGHGFSLLGSRCGDKRVTAVWLAKEGLKLGWCWAGNPHTWLGSASCAGRVAT